MPSLLNLFRSRTRKERRPPATAATADVADTAGGASSAFLARRKPRGRGAVASRSSTPTSDSPSTSAMSCRGDDDDDEDETLRSSDISVSVVVKEVAPMTDRLLRRIASLRGIRMMRNDSRGDRAVQKGSDKAAVGGIMAERDKHKDKAPIVGEEKGADEEEKEEEDNDEEASVSGRQLPACRRRRPPIRLRDVLCWPYATAAADEAADEAAEIERLYSVHAQLLQPIEGRQPPPPTPPTPTPTPAATAEDQRRPISREAAEVPPSPQLPSPNRAREPDESSSRLLAAEQLKEFLERRRLRRATEEAAAEAEAAAAVSRAATEGDNADVEIGRRPVYSAEQQRCLEVEQRLPPAGGKAVLYHLTHEVSSSTSSSSASSSSSDAAAPASSPAASTTADAGSASSQRFQQKRPAFLFADLNPVETAAADEPHASSDTSPDSASYLIATLRLTRGASVDRLEEPDD